MDVVELAGRLLFAAVFLISPAGVLKTAPRVAGTPMMKAFPPALGTLLIRVTCVASLVGGALIAVGLWPDVGALLVLVFLVPVTLTMHRFWDLEAGSLPRKQKRDVFLSNAALAGGALLLFAAVNQAQDVPLSLLSHPLFNAF